MLDFPPAYSERNFCTRVGALVLKRRIEEYWKERGYKVEIKLIDEGFAPQIRAGRTDVRSDMIGGRPCKKLVA